MNRLTIFLPVVRDSDFDRRRSLRGDWKNREVIRNVIGEGQHLGSFDARDAEGQESDQQQKRPPFWPHAH